MSKIMKCNCAHEVQDELYGEGNRIGNELRNGQLRCTVCGTIAGSQSAQPVKVKEVVVKEVVKEKFVKPSPDKKKEGKKEKKSDKKASMKGGKR